MSYYKLGFWFKYGLPVTTCFFMISYFFLVIRYLNRECWILVLNSCSFWSFLLLSYASSSVWTYMSSFSYWIWLSICWTLALKVFSSSSSPNRKSSMMSPLLLISSSSLFLDYSSKSSLLWYSTWIVASRMFSLVNLPVKLSMRYLVMGISNR